MQHCTRPSLNFKRDAQPIDNPEKQIEETSSPSSARFSFRFGTHHLLYIVGLLTSGFVVLEWWSLLLSGTILLIWFAIYEIKIKGRTAFEWVLVGIVIAVLLGMLLPAVQVNSGSHPSALCQNNMQQLLLAILNYEFAESAFPPAISTDEDGKPMHSWRVAILPYLEEPALFAQYDFSDPWDGPINSKLANQMPSIYRCQSSIGKGNETTYKLVCDEKAFFHADRQPHLEQCKDGTSTALILIEDRENPIHWMKPEDITTENAIRAILSQDGCRGRENSLLKTRIFGASAGFADASQHRIGRTTNPELVRQMININDGHSPDPRLLDGERVVQKPQGYIALSMYVLFLGLPGWIILRQTNSEPKRKF